VKEKISGQTPQDSNLTRRSAAPRATRQCPATASFDCLAQFEIVHLPVCRGGFSAVGRSAGLHRADPGLPPLVQTGSERVCGPGSKLLIAKVRWHGLFTGP